ncbi:flagellar hook-associated protein 3 [Pseudomonas fluorescens]|uniref:Flagellar hook-associated protein 3 n=1 Tax=Pseudomonas lactucae TaxID=2813360 RepID=A0A9X0YFS0_9PSED|nr:flagellar hook-associated protein 3 [Pseudomonas lactucae]OPA86911.1 flagellar hook-associated protein 3 [Pseudomonas fluorescens]MBN2978519.1 flagellar hook-associated protein 3 [Pseudomonas lactucae]MBN2986082.1 flagellar hook-associated protein 3 [Pseudomonas lactucae]OPB06485.1 flagellar hook-associated protein 3 [Pseudomonas fluorescens]OPB17769.1 flagellar hook-associated protein 3 [Pseudomonas fluorescens]
MRISTQQYFDTSSTKYQDNYSGVVKAQDQASTGVRVQTASDDPVAAAQLLMLQQQKDMLGQYNGNITTLQNSLNNEESVLSSISLAMQTASGLALQAGNLQMSNDDRKAIAAQVGALEDHVLGLLNSKDSSGNYMFSGAKTDTPPYSRNNDGTYTYQGDETPLSLQVSSNLSISMGDTGKTLLESSSNVGRTQTTLLPPSVNDGKVSISAGLVTSGTAYTKSFADGQPYKLTFASSTQYSVTDNAGNDVTSEITGNGLFDSTKEGASSVNLRGVKFDITLNLGAGVASGPPSDALVAGKEFTLESKPDTFSSSRTASNASTAQLTGGRVTDQAAYASTFPNSGAVIKFTSGTAYDVYAQPYTVDSKSIASGTIAAGATTVTTVGVTFDVSGTPGAGDQFSIGATSNKNMNALDTLGQLRKALEAPADGDPIARAKLKDVINTSIGNLANADAQINQVRGSIGARQNALDIQGQENTSLGLANTSTMSSLANVDMGQAAIDLTLQQTMLQASQLAFVKISQLSLFSRM